MRKIDIDDDVFQLLQEHAEPFTDTPNSVLRRLLRVGAGGVVAGGASARPRGGRAAPGSILPESEYEIPILRELVDRGGKGHATDITNAVGERLADRLTELDREPLDSGEIRWRNRVQFTRLTLKDRGFISPFSRRGIWEITNAGREFLAQAEADS